MVRGKIPPNASRSRRAKNYSLQLSPDEERGDRYSGERGFVFSEKFAILKKIIY